MKSEDLSRELERRLPAPPRAVAVLGSGLGDLFRGPLEIPYGDVPGFPVPSVAGHPGRLVFDGGVAILAGRVHLYEGFSAEEVVRPVRALALLGARTLVLTNAAGGLKETFRPGDLMLIKDHLNLTGANPLFGGPAFVDLSRAYDAGLLAGASRAAWRMGLRPRKGVYAAVPGPSYETPAEVRMLRRLGADAVGMSTVPEAIAGVEAGMKVLGVSLITNRCGGTTTHEGVLDVTRRAGPKLAALLRAILGLQESGRPERP